jgi:hypothetical protein
MSRRIRTILERMPPNLDQEGEKGAENPAQAGLHEGQELKGNGFIGP